MSICAVDGIFQPFGSCG
uniref:Oxysterol-binding protein-related protein 3B-like n=1 Tax=Rhizophora mucronata TaxID=61149 RepID=A0A2P2LDM4_RHIMU